MLDPSSSEDTGGESDPEVVQETPRKPAGSSAGKRGSGGGGGGRAGGQQRRSAAPAGAPGKGAKDSDATGEEEEERKERQRIQKEEEERKIKLQIYVFVLRCIAYPFNAKQPTDMARRQQKVSPRRPPTQRAPVVGHGGSRRPTSNKKHCRFKADSLT